MVAGLEADIAQCVINAQHALDIVFNCAVQVISSASENPELGVAGNDDFLLLGNIPALQLPELSEKLSEEAKRQAFLDIIIPIYENHGIKSIFVTFLQVNLKMSSKYI